MEIEVKNLSKTKVEIKGEMEWQEFEPYYDRALLNLGKDIKLKGFRPGKASEGLIEKEIGQEKIMSKAAELVLQEQFIKQVKENNLQVIAPPQAEILKLAFNNSFSFRLTLEVLPEIVLPDLKKAVEGVAKEKAEVKDQEVEQALKWLQKSRANLKDLETLSKKGDLVEIEYQSPEIEGNKKFKDQFILGEGHFAPGFEQELFNLKANQEKAFSLVFPSDYFQKNLAGKKVNFKAKMLNVKEMILPELNDQFVQGLGFKENPARPQTLLELKQAIRQGIQKDKEQAVREQWLGKALERIKQKTKIVLPESLIKKEALEQDKIKNQLFITEIIKQGKIEITEQEIDQAVQSFLTSYPQGKEDKKVDEIALRNYHKDRLYQEKILNFLENL